MRICEMVADGLTARGHEVAVLTSTYRHGDEFKPYPVYRSLPVDPDWNRPESAVKQFFIGRKAREKKAVESFHQVVYSFQPDVIFIWHGHGLPRLVFQEAENLPQVPVAYYFANYLPEMPDEYIPYWKAVPGNPLARILKGALAKIALSMLANEGKPVPLKYDHTISVSKYVRDRLLGQGLIGQDAVVIPNGVDLAVFNTGKRERPFPDNGPLPGTGPLSDNGSSNAALKGIVAGRVAPEKGIHTLLRALGLLHRRGQLGHIHVTILGDGPADYQSELIQIVSENNLQYFVSFQPPVPVEQMPDIYAQYDILLLPSEWHEPLSCTMLEAMACGLLVIGTTTGGSGEALFHQKTGLVFEPGDPEALATQLATVLGDRALVAQLAAAGEQEVLENFDMDRSVARIERYLSDLIHGENEVLANDSIPAR
jgi:glycogen(starch) synthase